MHCFSPVLPAHTTTQTKPHNRAPLTWVQHLERHAAMNSKSPANKEFNTPPGKPLWGSVPLPIKKQHLTSHTNVSTFSSEPPDHRTSSKFTPCPHHWPLSTWTLSRAMSYLLETGNVSQRAPLAVGASPQRPPHRQGLQQRLLMAVSPSSWLPRPGQSGNGCHRELGFRPQTFREEPTHPTISHASQSAAGMGDPSQKRHWGDPAASRAGASMPGPVPPSPVRHCSSGTAPGSAQSVRSCSSSMAAIVSPEHKASLWQ